MTGHKNIEEQHCQRKTVAPRTRPDFAAGHFRSHEARSPQNSTRPAIHIHVVGIANSYIPGIWIEEQIAEIDVAIAESRWNAASGNCAPPGIRRSPAHGMTVHNRAWARPDPPG